MRECNSARVAAAVIENPAGEILLARRPSGKPMAGRWEFPGGKLHDGERPSDALARELHEELGICVEQARRLIALHHDYPELSVDLNVFRVARYHGEPRPLEGQRLAWVSVDQLHEWNLLEADGPIVTALRLPDRCWVTPSPGTDPEAYLRQIEATLKRGLPMLQCRLTKGDGDRLALGRAVGDLCRRHGATFIWNGTAREAEALRADGLHLSAKQLMCLDARPPFAGWIGASCHAESEVRYANRLGLDYLFVGTVKATPSHPGGPVLGWEGFEKRSASSNVPVYAIGGMKVVDIGRAWELGGQGIAAIRGLSVSPLASRG